MNKKNNVSVIGNLGDNPQYGISKAGKPYCRMTICINTNKFNPQTKQYEQVDQMWMNAICFDKLAETAGNYLQKGTLIQIEGYFKKKDDTYIDKNQKQVRKIETQIFAESISIPLQALPKIMGNPNNANINQTPSQNFQRPQQQYQQQYQPQTPQQQYHQPQPQPVQQYQPRGNWNQFGQQQTPQQQGNLNFDNEPFPKSMPQTSDEEIPF